MRKEESPAKIRGRAIRSRLALPRCNTSSKKNRKLALLFPGAFLRRGFSLRLGLAFLFLGRLLFLGCRLFRLGGFAPWRGLARRGRRRRFAFLFGLLFDDNLLHF